MSSAIYKILHSYVSDIKQQLEHPQNGSKKLSTDNLKKCIKNLVEFCQISVLNKKLIEDEKLRKSISDAVQAIKILTPQYAKHSRKLISDDPFLTERFKKCSVDIMACVNIILQSFEESRKMDPFEALLNSEDTLYFDFQLTRIDDERTAYCEHPGSSFKKQIYPRKSVSCEGIGAPLNLSAESASLNLLDENSELVSSAYAVMEKVKKLIVFEKDKGHMRNLQRRLNQAIIEYDASTNNLLEDLSSTVMKKQLMNDAKALIWMINEMKDFLEMQSANKAALKEFDNVSTKSFSKTDCSPAIATTSRGILHPKQTDSVSNLKSNPIYKHRLYTKAKQLCSLVTSSNAAEFEESLNDVSEYQDSVKKIVIDIKSCYGKDETIEEMLNQASRTTRQLIREARSLFIKDSLKENDICTLEVLAQEWSDVQEKLLNNIWRKFAPWTEIISQLFHSESSEMVSNQSTSKFNNSIKEFKQIKSEIQRMVGNFMEISENDVLDEDGRSHQVKSKNLLIELKDYSNKLLQVAKLHLLKDIKDDEWLLFGIWLFRWANCLQQLFHHLSSITLPCDSFQHPITTEKMLTQQHNGVKYIAEQTIQSCQESECKSTLVVALNELTDAYCAAVEKTKDDHPLCNVYKTLQYAHWKIKAYQLLKMVEETTRYLSSPVDALIKPSIRSEQNLSESYKDIFIKKMERIRTHTCLAVDKCTNRAHVHKAIETMDVLNDISENILLACPGIKGREKRIPISVSLHLLRLQWLSSSNYLLYLLRQTPDVRYAAISAIMRHFLSAQDVSSPDEFSVVMNDQVSPTGCISYVPSMTFSSSSAIAGHDVDGSEFDSVYSTWADYSENSENINDASVHEIHNVQSHEGTYQLTPFQKNDSHEDETKSSKPPPVSPKPKNYKLNNNASNSNERIQQPFTKSIAAAAKVLHLEADKWEEENNSIIKAVKLMANQMFQMAEFSCGRGTLRSKEELVMTAKAIAANAKTVAKFAGIIADHCTDLRCRNDLLHYIELVPTISTQLRIVASVKSVTTDDATADLQLVSNADNLMKAVVATLKTAEAACVMIPNKTFMNLSNTDESCEIGFQWKRNVRMRRALDAISSPKDELGLRLSRNLIVPSLTDIVFE